MTALKPSEHCRRHPARTAAAPGPGDREGYEPDPIVIDLTGLSLRDLLNTASPAIVSAVCRATASTDYTDGHYAAFGSAP